MKYVSLFAGIGGFDLALEKLGYECVYANDIDRYCKIIYDKNFCNCFDRSTDGGSKKDQKGGAQENRKGLVSEEGKTTPITERSFCQYPDSEHRKGAIHLDTRSITTVDASDIPDHDLLVGGFPCQAFSIAGKRRGFAETRGTLFFDIARILDAKRPSWFLLENVKGLLNHDSGRTFKTIISTLTELGYDAQWQVLNSKNFGVPQNRERVYIVGHIRGKPRPKIFPLTGANKSPNEGIVSTTIDANYWKGIDNHGQRTAIVRLDKDSPHYQDRVYGVDGVSPTLPTGTGGNHQPKIINNIGIRRLTPTECERLQSFPDGWTEGVSDTQRYKMLGNAVTSNVIYEIMRRFNIDI